MNVAAHTSTNVQCEQSVCNSPHVLALDERADASASGVRECTCGHAGVARLRVVATACGCVCVLVRHVHG